MYTLKSLPYQYQDLEPFIDTHTMGLHYHKHLQNYLNKLNMLLEKNNFDYAYPIEELPKHYLEFPKEDQEDLLFNVGGVLNHYIYFQSMNPNFEKPKGLFLEQLTKEFGNYQNFISKLKKESLELKGSGYLFLVIDKNKKLSLIPMKNQDTPYTYDLIPLFCIDLWEHAYYINYENKKDLYIDNFLEVADYRYANAYFSTQKRES